VFFSVILPVYNSEEYLHECLESILKQSYSKFEIIVINDGSTDSSGEICNEFAKKDERIKVIHQVNMGQTFARGVGMEVSQGEYIVFADSDDWLESNELSVLYKNIKKFAADIIFFDFYSHTSKGAIVKNVNSINKITLKKEGVNTIARNLLFDQQLPFGNVSIFPSLWSKAFKRDLLLANYNKINKELSVGEDLVLLASCLSQAKTIAYCDQALYNYRLLPNSVYHRYNPKAVANINLLYKNLTDILQESEFFDYQNNLRCYFFREVWNIARRIINSASYAKLKEQLELIDDDLLSEIKQAKFYNRSLKERILISLIKANYWRFLAWIYRLSERIKGPRIKKFT
jgi:glycosyltransferase involved in cell wall biosynthesis